MEPRDRGRFCASCQFEVMDVSAYPAEQALERVRAADGRLCVSYRLRDDGSIRFADSPDVTLRSLTRRSRAFALAASVSLAACAGSSQRLAGAVVAEPQIVGDLAEPPAETAPPAVDDPSTDGHQKTPPTIPTSGFGPAYDAEPRISGGLRAAPELPEPTVR